MVGAVIAMRVMQVTVDEIADVVQQMSASGQTRKFRTGPLHVCFIPKTGPLGTQARMSVKGHKRSSGNVRDRVTHSMHVLHV